MGKGWAHLCHDTIRATITCVMAQVYCQKRIIGRFLLMRGLASNLELKRIENQEPFKWLEK